MSTCTSCGGTIEDGYCNVCGLAAAPAASVPTGSGPSGSASGGSGSAGSGTADPGRPAAARPRGTRGTRGSRRTSGRSARGRLGAGLVEIPPVPYRDPASAILADPQVPENRRFCASCEQPVGRGQDGRAGLTEGFCRNCGTRFSFSPKLEPGDLVAGQYEVLGCLAFGGLGWIYLARDHNVSDRWVVLKGLLNTGDADAMAAAVAERQFLAQVEHPNIVRIYNFVQHADRRTGESAGYIVMEYVGGKSLKQILQDARRDGGSVPLAHAIAYAIEVLPALGYLHDRGLVYCDFKPDNVIQTEEQLKLIDMGGVRGVDSEGPIYGTVGYQAPEIGTDGPSVSSDLFTVARALAVLTFEFKGYQSNYKFTFPDAVPLLEQQESFARLLRRATHRRPRAQVRFGRGDGRAAHRGAPRGARDRRRHAPAGLLHRVQPRAPGDRANRRTTPSGRASTAGARRVPQRRPDHRGDADAAGGPGRPGGRLPGHVRRARLRPASGRAVRRGLGRRSRARRGRHAPPRPGWRWRAPSSTSATTTEPEPRWPTWPPRTRPTGGSPGPTACAGWLPGRQTDGAAAAAARGAFSAVYDDLPGELAPKLALAFAAEAAGDAASAARYFKLVWTVDRSCISAAFGLARACLATGDRPGAIAALAAVPETSSYHAAAQIAAVRILVSSGMTGDDLQQASGRLGRLALDEARRQQLTVEILRAALGWAEDSGRAPARISGDGLILGCEPNERSLRFGLERGYRALARLTSDRSRRIELVDMANAVRPKTWS